MTGDVTSPDGQRENPFLIPLFRDLNEVLKDTIRPVAQALTRHIGIRTHFLVALEAELMFYLGAAQLIGQVRAQQAAVGCLVIDYQDFALHSGRSAQSTCGDKSPEYFQVLAVPNRQPLRVELHT